MLKVAVVFTLGCSVLVVNSILCFMPYISLRLNLPPGMIYVEGVLSVMSCTIFLVGSTFAFLETLQANFRRGGRLRWRLEPATYTASTEAIVEKGNDIEKAPGAFPIPEAHHVYQNSSHANLFGHSGNLALENDGQRSNAFYQSVEHGSRNHIPSAHKERMHFYDLGVLASAIFLCSSAIYCGTSIASMVTILNFGKVARWIRYPQLVAAIGFAVASLLLIVKIQRNYGKNWWRPAVHSLGWYVNLWNLVGSAGFFFCAYFGLLENTPGAEFQFGCSYLWGSWALLLGSAIQWYRTIRKEKTTSTRWMDRRDRSGFCRKAGPVEKLVL